MQRRTIYGVLLSIFLISGLSIYGFFCRRCTPPPSLIKADLYINSVDLSRSFETNEALSDSLYLYKVLSVRGAVEKIVKREAGNYVITLGDRGSGKTVVDCSLDTIYNRRALSLKNGDSVTVRGTCAGRMVNVILMQCIIEK